MKVVPEDELITNPVITLYELCKLLSVVTEYVYKTNKIHMDASKLYMSTKQLSPEQVQKLSNDEIFNIEGEPHIMLHKSVDIAKVMINQGVAPMIIYREIGRDPSKMIIHIEKWDVNQLQKEILVPMS